MLTHADSCSAHTSLEPLRRCPSAAGTPRAADARGSVATINGTHIVSVVCVVLWSLRLQPMRRAHTSFTACHHARTQLQSNNTHTNATQQTHAHAHTRTYITHSAWNQVLKALVQPRATISRARRDRWRTVLGAPLLAAASVAAINTFEEAWGKATVHCVVRTRQRQSVYAGNGCSIVCVPSHPPSCSTDHVVIVLR